MFLLSSEDGNLILQPHALFALLRSANYMATPLSGESALGQWRSSMKQQRKVDVPTNHEWHGTKVPCVLPIVQRWDSDPFRTLSQWPAVVECTSRHEVSAFSGLYSPRISKRRFRHMVTYLLVHLNCSWKVTHEASCRKYVFVIISWCMTWWSH